MNVYDLIKNSLKYFDNQTEKYKEIIFDTIPKFNEIDFKISITDNKDNILLSKHFEILGTFDQQTKVWVWAWMLPYLHLETISLSKKLLDYGLKLEPESNNIDHFYIKSQLINSRFLIENNIELDIHLAVVSYLLKDNHLFIYPYRIYFNKEKTKYQTVYYIIK